MAALAREEYRVLFRDNSALVGFKTACVKSAPAVGGTGFDDFVEAFAFAFSEHDAFLRPEIRSHDFDQRIAAAADARRKSLTDHPSQRVGQAIADLLLLV